MSKYEFMEYLTQIPFIDAYGDLFEIFYGIAAVRDLKIEELYNILPVDQAHYFRAIIKAIKAKKLIPIDSYSSLTIKNIIQLRFRTYDLLKWVFCEYISHLPKKNYINNWINPNIQVLKIFYKILTPRINFHTRTYYGELK